MIRNILLLLILTGLGFSQTSSWQLEWNKNSETDMSHYIIYRDVTPTATAQVDTLNHLFNAETIATYVDLNLTRGVRYYYRLKAEDTNSNQSGFSNEVSAAIPNILLTNFSFQNQTVDNILYGNLFYDPDHSHTEHTVTATNQTNVIVTINTNFLTIQPSPSDFVGTATFTLNVEDPTLFFDEQTVSVDFISTIPSTPILETITRD